MNGLNVFVPLAQAAGGGAGGGQSSMFPFLMMGMMILVFYFILIRPQQRREKERRAMIENAKTGDRVVCCGGIIGVIANVKDKTFLVKIADNVKIEVGRYAVNQVLDKGEGPEENPK